MKIGVTIPNHFGVEDFSQVSRLGVLAEELGFDSIWVMDHLFNAGYIKQRLGDKPYYHPLATLSYVAAKTSRITLGTSVIVLPYHSPFDLAKYVATLDHMSGGRLVLGVGVGGIAEENALLGVPYQRRGSIANEMMLAMKALWTEERPKFQGRFYNFEDGIFSPKPLQKPHVPMWVGGATEGAKKRAALLGDGWHPIAVDPEAYAAACEEVRSMAAAAGRDPATITMSIRVNVDVEAPRPGSAEPPAVRLGTVSEMNDAFKGYEAAGCEHVCIAFDSGDVGKLEARMREIASGVLPNFR